eukprot:8254652-Pyramimonas_sp.AAC.1
MWRVFCAADVLGGLGLKFHKCVIIPLEGEFSRELEKDMRQWLLTLGDTWVCKWALRRTSTACGAKLRPSGHCAFWSWP